MKKLVTLVVMAAIANVARAADWETISTNATSVVEVEKSMLKRHGLHVLTWTRESFAKTQTTNQYQYDVIVSRYDIDCSSDTASLVSATLALDGKKVFSTDPGTSTQFSAIYPDSSLNRIEKAVCRPGM